jgi:hypothetical protein
MGLSVKTGSFSSGTGAIDSTVAVTGVGFQPKVVLLWTSADTGASANDQSMSFGVGISPSSRRAISAYCNQSSDPSVCKSRNNNALALLVVQGSTPTIVGTFDFTSQDADGFTLKVGTQFSASITVFYLALGGTDITNVGLATVSQPATNIDFSDTTLGFKPDFLMIFSTIATSDNSNTGNAVMCIGFTDGTNASLTAINSSDGAATSATGTYIRAAASQLEIYSNGSTGTGSPTQRSSFKSFDTNGFTLTSVETTASATLIYALGIKGGRWHAGSYATVTPAGNFSATDMTFTPTGLFVVGPKGSAQSTSDTAAANAKLSLGAADGTTQGTAAAAGNNGVAANNNYWNALSTSQLYKNLAGTTGADQEMGTFVSFNSNGWTGNAATTSGINFGIYFGFAANAAGAADRRVIMVS